MLNRSLFYIIHQLFLVISKYLANVHECHFTKLHLREISFNLYTAYPFLSLAFHSTRKEVSLGSSDGMVIYFFYQCIRGLSWVQASFYDYI